MDVVFKLMDTYPAIPIGMLALLIVLWLLSRRQKRREHESSTGGFNDRRRAPATVGGLLSQVLFWFSPRDPLRVVDLLRSIAIFGASGSGKTSGSGYQLAKAIIMAAGLRIGGLILASKPEDRE